MDQPRAETAPDQDLAARVNALPWYHTFDLPGGITTVGLFDHRKVVKKLPIPASLKGKRCLDVASSDGFFAFEMARRGADHVVSLDLPDHGAQDFQGPPRDDPGRSQWSGRANQCFALVMEATGLKVERVDGSVYDMDDLDLGKFDFVFMGNILLHLRDPVLALLQVRGAVGGELLSYEAISLPMTVLRPMVPTGQLGLDDGNSWWTPNMRGHRRLLAAGGFEVTSGGGPLFQPFGLSQPRWPKRSSLPRSMHELTYWMFTRRFGGATAWAMARPRA